MISMKLHLVFLPWRGVTQDVCTEMEKLHNNKQKWVKSSGPIPLVADETVIKEWEDRMEKAATTTSSLAVEQDSGSSPRCQDTIFGGVEAQIRFEAASKQSNDPPLSKVNILGNGEDSMKLKELMELCIKLPERALDLA
ncbi:hypothetical protein Tco_1442180 [Tanacetum coccineum]